jgi:Amt family ammonium transporter
VSSSLAFADGGSLQKVLGGLQHALLRGVGLETGAGGAFPDLLFLAFQGTFAVITAALLSGGVGERMRFDAYLMFIALWGLLVYAPIAYWIWGGGWLGELGALDFAGGTVVHVNAGVAALVAALLVGPRRDYGRQAILPHNVPFVLLGAALLWFGWFGFNGGSALAASESAALAFVNTMLAPMAAMLVWMGLDLVRTRQATAVGVATAVVVGLVAITPAAGFVSPLGALAIGTLAAFPSYAFLLWRARSALDDSLDVFGTHGIGGLSGALLTGVFASSAWGGASGLLEGNAAQLGIQALAALAALIYSAAVSFGLLRLIALFLPLRADERAERVGLDVTAHGEEAYTTGEGALLLLDGGEPQALAERPRPLTAGEGGELA